jgi:hypothetical protein
MLDILLDVTARLELMPLRRAGPPPEAQDAGEPWPPRGGCLTLEFSVLHATGWNTPTHDAAVGLLTDLQSGKYGRPHVSAALFEALMCDDGVVFGVPSRKRVSTTEIAA